MRQFFIFILSTLYCLQSQSQTLYSITGEVFSDSNQPLFHSSIRIRSSNTSLILAFYQTGNSNSFRVPVTANANDTLIVTASREGYLAKDIMVPVTDLDTLAELVFNLTLLTKEMETVVIKLPPVWKRGDTTFFKVDSFKTGYETKLRDIIKNLPGFALSDDGILTYNRKPVEKILLDGEELFADKVITLVNNVPVHILNTVQAIENQNSNRLLKGLSGDGKVFLNLGLKKEVNTALFGDIQIGAGSKKRYLFNPVLFSLYKKTGMGLIVNKNNTGLGSGDYELREIIPPEIRLLEPAFIRTSNIQMINGLENRRYIRNDLWDNDLQVNVPLSDKLKLQTEVNYLQDRQSQATSYQSRLLDANGFFDRVEHGNFIYKPRQLTVNTILLWNADSSRDIKLGIGYGINRTSSFSMVDIHQSDSSYHTNNEIRNQWQNLSLRFSYLRRRSIQAAENLKMEYHILDLPQYASSFSGDWPFLFSVSDNYNLLNQANDQRVVIAKAQYETISKKATGLRSFQFNAAWTGMQSAGTISVHNPLNQMDNIRIGIYSSAGDYGIGKFYLTHKKQFRVFKNPLQLELDAGVSRLIKTDPGISKNNWQLLVKSHLFQQRRYNRYLSDITSVYYQQQPVDIFRLHTTFFPRGIAQFYRNSNTMVPQKNLMVNYSLVFITQKLQSGSIGFSFFNHFTSSVYLPLYSGLVFTMTDSVAKKPTRWLHINTETTFPLLLIKTRIKAGASYMYSERLLNQQGRLLVSRMRTQQVFIEARKNWNKVLFLTLSAGYQRNVSEIPSAANGKSSFRSVNMRTQANLRYQVTKFLGAEFRSYLYRNNLLTPYEVRLFLADFELSFKASKKPYSLQLRIDNLTNRNVFQDLSFFNHLNQSFGTVPLIGRNVLGSVRFEF